MLFHVGGDGSRPTFFEMVAAEHLPGSLKAALHYSLGVMAQRRPILHRVLDRYDEVYALLMLLLEAHSIRTTDASFAEGLYGLKRAPAEISVRPASGAGEAAPAAVPPALPSSKLTRRRRLLSLLFLVGVPYLRSKLQSVYEARRGRAIRDTLWAGDSEDDEEGTDRPWPSPRGPSDLAQSTLQARVQECVLSGIATTYPWLNAALEGAAFLCQTLYLLDGTQFYSPWLLLAGVHVRRATGQELMDAEQEIESRRARELARLRGPWLLQALQRGVVRSLYTALDYTRTGLVASVFLFKMLEWWFQSAEARVTAPAVFPPPPSPPPPKLAEGGLSLPKDKRVCPLCARPRTNPALVSSSGFVFCYPCVFNYVSQYGRCPVTFIPATTDGIRRLYHNA